MRNVNKQIKQQKKYIANHAISSLSCHTYATKKSTQLFNKLILFWRKKKKNQIVGYVEQKTNNIFHLPSINFFFPKNHCLLILNITVNFIIPTLNTQIVMGLQYFKQCIFSLISIRPELTTGNAYTIPYYKEIGLKPEKKTHETVKLY